MCSTLIINNGVCGLRVQWMSRVNSVIKKSALRITDKLSHVKDVSLQFSTNIHKLGMCFQIKKNIILFYIQFS